jgi:Na+/H+ antiporter NhaD/arsenite permease-like protein
MLWIGGQITAGSIIQSLFVPSLVGLGLLWMVGDVLHKGKTMEERSHLELSHALSRIDMYSIVFFIGILLAVA